MRLQTWQIDELIRIYSLKARRRDASITEYARQLAQETVDGLKELRRQRVPVEGQVS